MNIFNHYFVFFGPFSPIIDLITFAVIWYVLTANTVSDQALFQSG